MTIKDKLKDLPKEPGVYLMKNEKGQVIYVGKAKVLKNRVSQYFRNSSNHTSKVRAMVGHIVDFEYIITDSEMEALVLESNLIKKHYPKYNVLLRDDKQYPYIKITIGEKYPRIIKTRKVYKDKAKYFGPYTQVSAVNQTIDLIKKFYPLRTCRKNLEKNNERPCLNYHIKKCIGPCTGNVSNEEYMKMIDEIILFLNGKDKILIEKIEEKMKSAAMNMEFELAANYRDQIMAIKAITERQKIISTSDIDQDIIAVAKGTEYACVMIFFIRSGKLIGREKYTLSNIDGDSKGEIISSFVKQFYSGTPFIPKEILVETDLEDNEIIEKWLSTKKDSKVSIKAPKRGEKKELVDLVHKNAVEMLNEENLSIMREKEKSQGALDELSKLLGIEGLKRLEAFDISNTQGIFSVASMVVFEDGKSKRSDYRRFKIKTTENINDYASMQEVIFRRLRRGLEEKEKLTKEKALIGKFNDFPDLILVDGGLGHVNAATEILNALNLNIPIAGMVKDDRHRTRGLIYEGEEINIQKQVKVYQLIGKIQEEAHRFAITYHKSLRGKTMVESILDEIKGIGPNRRKSLLKEFKTIEKIKEASIEELAKVDGMNTKAAKEVYDFFKKKK
ncbi:excinuclease ABC subunit UvrC [Anaeromicrobium sediminis]|uniref:UvrABC system protein C n=1 Tax=Anaeromicrobium sediminis TaxID=1478221 RepID=A0A267MEW1_9FIRM|nr:excinuclease ABC subunit UvrC [Anaeromicrobium sediminis]PAB58121.1 excinuclease ABC subunit C [Anaeromicrobium sediminis]